MTAVIKFQLCNECCCLKIQCSLVLAGGWRGPKWKAELDTEEMVQPKWLKPIIEVSGMRLELTTQEGLLEHSELLGDVQGLQRAVAAMGLATDDIIKWMSRMEEGSRSGNEGAWSV